MTQCKDITKVNLALEPYQIILRPLVTEKGYALAERDNIYFFEVNKLANKNQIKEAVEALFEVKVVEVRTQNRKGKKVRSRRGSYGKRKDWKKALVKLDAEHRINYF